MCHKTYPRFVIHPLSSLEHPEEGLKPRLEGPPFYSNVNMPSCFPTSPLLAGQGSQISLKIFDIGGLQMPASPPVKSGEA